MNANTESLIIRELIECGLNPKAIPVIEQLFAMIENGHTALKLEEEKEQLLGQLSDELSPLLSVHGGYLQNNSSPRHALEDQKDSLP